MNTEKNQDVDGYKVIEEFLLTKGEQVVSSKMTIPFKPLIEFGLIVYGMKVNATNKLSMKFDLEKFFMRHCAGELSGTETKTVKVPQDVTIELSQSIMNLESYEYRTAKDRQ